VQNEVQNALLRWWPAGLVVIGAVVAFFSTVTRTLPEKLSVNVARPMPPSVSKPEQLGDYSQPAPGASVEILPDPEER
jgi:hypothetical protein